MPQKHYSVTGMSCGHCVASITEEVGEVTGVREVAVDLAASTVTVYGTDLDDHLVRAAIVEAGHGVSGPVPA
ncbi:heavy-metal-associated domain-containing protein [Streptomyces sp. NPDC059165]|uniref:heavy-metal-associated domain-containing protein n=1 Tax=Streptomyces sp. NPDC059165 TaxID=3346751 RepID=UPI0036CF1D00